MDDDAYRLLAARDEPRRQNTELPLRLHGLDLTRVRQRIDRPGVGRSASVSTLTDRQRSHAPQRLVHLVQLLERNHPSVVEVLADGTEVEPAAVRVVDHQTDRRAPDGW